MKYFCILFKFAHIVKQTFNMTGVQITNGSIVGDLLNKDNLTLI